MNKSRFLAICRFIKSVIQNHVKAIVVLVSLFVLANAFNLLYNNASIIAPDTHSFQSSLNEKINKSSVQLNYLQKEMKKKGVKKMPLYNPDKAEDIFYYIYRGDSLVFWTENELGTPIHYSSLNQKTPLLQLQHAYCIRQERRFKRYKIIALIKLKNDYQSPNEFLRNDFAKSFNLTSDIQLINGNKKDENAIFSPHGQYLFSLSNNANNHSYYIFALLSILCWIGFLGSLFFYIDNSYKWLLKRKRPSLRYFLVVNFLMATGIYWCLQTDTPDIIFSTDLFSPIHYASGNMFPSLGHLVIISAFFLLQTLFFHFKVQLKPITLNGKRFYIGTTIVEFFNLIIFVGAYLLFKNLNYNSSFEISLVDIESLSFTTIIALLLIFSWFLICLLFRRKSLNLIKTKGRKKLVITSILVCLIFSMLGFLICPSEEKALLLPLWFLGLSTTSNFFLFIRKDSSSLRNIGGSIIVFSAFVVFFTVHFSRTKQMDKYVIMAENIDSDGLLDRNMFAEILFDEMDKNIVHDDSLHVITNSEKYTEISLQNYMMNTYFRGFWNNYDIKCYLFNQNHYSKTDIEKTRFYNRIIGNANQIKHTHFYFCSNKRIHIDYIGRFDLKGQILYIEMYSKLLASSYSYPEPLLRSDEKGNISNEISIASYEDNLIHSQKGDFNYPTDSRWIPKDNRKTYIFNYKGYNHFVYKDKSKNVIVISQKHADDYNTYIMFWIYLFLGYFIFVMLVNSAINMIQRRKENTPPLSIVGKLQLVSLLLLGLSFIAVFFISSNYIINQYEENQSLDLRDKTQYIQTYLQEAFKELKDLRQTNQVNLGFYLQDLSNTYKTDIHLYDLNGMMIATSQPGIFAKGLASKYMSPIPFFEKKENYTQTEHIGQLSYLSAYTRLYNSHGNLIGFLAVPSFLSSDQIHKEIFSLTSITVNVYLIVMAISALLNILITKQMSKPLIDLKGRLKSIRLKGNNEKLSYSRNDEIGQLVKQYNKMVEMLDDSADKLAKNERETAWKQMARQVTHEIKNPLTPMKLTIQQLQRMQGGDDQEAFNAYFKKTSAMLIEQIENLSNIATAFSDFAKMPEAKRERVDIQAKIESIVSLFADNDEHMRISYTPIVSDNPPIILADKEQLTQVFNNLIKNAIQAIPSGNEGRIDISLSEENEKVKVTIKDNGTGIEECIREKLFTPNFTTKSSGMGLGLAIVKNIVDKNGGNIWFDTEVGAGTSFYVEFSKED